MIELLKENWVIVAGVLASAAVLLGPELRKLPGLVLKPFKRKPADNTVELLLELKTRLKGSEAESSLNEAIIIVLELDK